MATGALPNVMDYDLNKVAGSTIAPTQFEPQDNSLVSNQLTKLLSKDSSYMQSARTKAMQSANSRGLLNSSMAAGAGEQAAIDSAMPIAQQDAQSYFTAQRDNANAKNQFDGATNAFGREGALAKFNQQINRDNQLQEQGFRRGESALDRQQQMTMQGMDFSFRAGESNADRAQRLEEQARDFGFRGTQAGMDRSFQSGESEKTRTFTALQAGLDRTQQTALQNSQFSFQGGQANLDRQQQTMIQRLQEAGMDVRQATQLAEAAKQAGLDRVQQTVLQDKQFTFQGTQAERDRQQQTMLQQLQEAGMDRRQASTIVADEKARVSTQTFQAAQAGLDRNQQIMLQDADFSFRYDQGTLDRNQQRLMQQLQESGMDFRQAQQLTQSAVQASLDREQQRFIQDDNQVFQAMQMTQEQSNMMQRMGYADLLQQGQVKLQDTISKSNLTTNMKVALAERSQTAIMQIMADPNLSAVRPTSPAGALSPKEQAIQNVNGYVQSEVDRIVVGFNVNSSGDYTTGGTGALYSYVGR